MAFSGLHTFITAVVCRVLFYQNPKLLPMLKALRIPITFLLFLLCGYAGAQTVTGKVVSASDGSGIPGVSVLLKGSTLGTTTDSDGKYTLSGSEVPTGTLVFSFIGFATQEVVVGNQSTVDVTLQEDIRELNEVVVTALGVTKEAQKIGFAVTTVDGNQLNRARETNMAVALEGRVAGLNVKGNNSGPAGTARILLRGMPSMTGVGAGPLFVINGVPMDNTQRGSAGEWGGSDNGDGIGNINPDDIESMTVLKGQSASALYGARASNGVILITTKKGKKGDFTVEYNSNFLAEKAMNLTDFQYEYGQGVGGAKPLTAAAAQGTSRLSWGAKLDGQPTIQFDGKQYAYSAQKDNIKNFYRTGSSFTNTVALAKGGDNGSFRLSLSNLDNKSIIPNSGLNRKTVNLTMDQAITPKLKVSLMANYIDEGVRNKAALSDGPMNATNGMFLATNVDQRILAPGYNTTTGVETRYGDDEYVTNPYFVTSQYRNNVGRKRLITSTSARYDVTKWLYAQGRVGYDYSTDRVFKVEPWGTAYTNGQRGNLQEQSTGTRYELNVDGLVGINKELTTDFTLDALIGANMRKYQEEYVRVAGSQFVLPYLYTLSNVLNVNTNPNDNYKFKKKQVNSAYYSIDLSYQRLLTLSTTGRYDAYSTLAPLKSISIFTPSVSGAFMFSELMESRILSFGKLRASWANTSGDAGDPYKTQLYYQLGSPFNGIPMGSFGTEQPNGLLKPFRLTEIEIGTDLKFFDARLGLDLAWYTRKTTNEIMPATFSPATGFNTGYVGTGSTQNSGLEVLLTGVPIKTQKFNWNVSFNLTTVKNEILQTGPDGNPLNQGSNRGTLGNAITAFVKGYAGPQILAFDYRRSASGEIVVDASGLPVQGDLIKAGTVLPKVYGGLNNEFNYQRLNFSFLIDYNFGNKTLSATEYYSLTRGLNKKTLVGREEGITTGVRADGTANTTTATAQAYYTAVAQRITTSSVVSGDFIKLRQIMLGYTIPLSLFGKVPLIRTAHISFVARNVAILKRDSKNIDPEASFSSDVKYYGIEGGSLPSTRSYGVNLNVTFK